MKNILKRTAAAALSLALIGGVMPFEAGTFDLSKISLTAEAASKPYIYDSDTKTLYFVDDTDLYAAKGIDDVCNRSEVLHIMAKNGISVEWDFISTFTSVETLDFSYARVWGRDTSFANSLKDMTSLKSVNFSNTTFGCYYAHIHFSGMFWGCTSLEQVDMTGVTLEKPLAGIYDMFRDCENLTSFKYDLDTSQIEEMDGMFRNCSSLKSIDLSKMDASNVNSMISMFNGCTDLEEIKLPTNLHPRYMQAAFADCQLLTDIDLSFFDFTGSGEQSILENCINLKSFTVNTRVPNATTLYLPFETGWGVSTDPELNNVATDSYGLALFPDVNGTTTFVRRSAYITEGSCFTFNEYTHKMTLFGNVNKNEIKEFNQRGSVKIVEAKDGTVFPANSSFMFQSYSSLEDVRLNNVDTSKVTNMTRMFHNCKNLGMTGHALEIDQWDTSNVTAMTGLFQNCKNLKYGTGIGDWDTSKVTSMSYMFSGCSSLPSIHIESWITDKVTNLSNMFFGCSSLTELTLGTKGITNDPYNDCWHISPDAEYSDMFRGCTSLQKLYIFNFQISADNAPWVFALTPSLYEIGLGGGAQVSENMYLDNTYGWTSSRSHARVSGTGEYAVFTAPENCYTVFNTMQGFTPVDLTAMSAAEFFIADRPYPGNTADQYTSYNSGKGYTVDNDNSGWFDVDNDRFLSKTDRLMPGGAYIYRVRLVPSAAKYFEQPTNDTIEAVTFADYDDRTLKYLNCVGAHLNDDGTLDLYASLIRSLPRYYDKTNLASILQSSTKSKAYTMPEGSVSYSDSTGGYVMDGYIDGHRLLPLASRYNATPTSIWWKMGMLAYENVFDDCAYELSIDGKNYVSMVSMNGKTFTGLAPSTEYTISLRLAGETKPFFSEKAFTAIDNSTPATLSTASVSFGGAIGLNYYVALSDNIKNDPGAYAEFTINGRTIRQMVSETPVDSKGFNKFTCSAYATQMRDNINFKLCNGNGERYDMKTASGVDCSENGFDYTVAKYLIAICSSTSNTKMADFARAALNYGAAAQIYFGYNTEALANGQLTSAQKALATDPSTINIKSDASEETISSPKAQFTGKNLLLGNNVSIVYYMTFDSSVDKNKVTLELSYKNILGEQITKSVPFKKFIKGDHENEYRYDLSDIKAKDSCCPVTAKLCVNGTQISSTITYSIQTYAYNKLNKSTTSESLKTIITALMVYCKSAEKYFSA